MPAGWMTGVGMAACNAEVLIRHRVQLCIVPALNLVVSSELHTCCIIQSSALLETR